MHDLESIHDNMCTCDDPHVHVHLYVCMHTSVRVKCYLVTTQLIHARPVYPGVALIAVYQSTYMLFGIT